MDDATKCLSVLISIRMFDLRSLYDAAGIIYPLTNEYLDCKINSQILP